jgi:hypothetical protein
MIRGQARNGPAHQCWHNQAVERSDRHKVEATQPSVEGHNRADRWCMYQGKPQKYGTQYVSDGIRQRLWDVDPSATDAERAAWNIPPLAEQLRKAEEATRIDPPQPINRDDAPWWLKEALLRWSVTEGLSAG